MYSTMQVPGRYQLAGDAETSTQSVTNNGGELATTMVLRGAFGTLIGAAVAPKGREGVWGAAGFVVGTVFGQPGILAVALTALWNKATKD